MTHLPIALIWAMAENRVIGASGKLPWRLPDEMRHFQRITMSKPVIMGRRTFASLRRPLPDRINIVVTHNAALPVPPEVLVARDLDSAVSMADTAGRQCGAEEIIVAGGAALYALALPRARRLYITVVHAECAGDTYFPEFAMRNWVEKSSAHHVADEHHRYPFTMCVLDRVEEV